MEEKCGTTKRIQHIIELVEEHEGLIGVIGTSLTGLYGVFNYIYNLLYQIQCEKFYGILGKYFSTTIEYWLLYIGCVLVILGVCIIPAMIKRHDGKNGNTAKSSIVYAVLMCGMFGLELGSFNVSNLVQIMRQTYGTNVLARAIGVFLDSHAVFTVVAVLGVSFFSLLGITLADEIRGIKTGWFKHVVDFVVTVSLVISVLATIGGTVVRLSVNIEDKTRYEFVSIEDTEYVILAKMDDECLCVTYSIEENGQYIFNTERYYFFQRGQGNYQYVDIVYGPKINNGNNDGEV